MKISLAEFESGIDTAIISRWHDYFSNSTVRDLNQIKDGAWAASVDGTETYSVRIILKGDDLVDWSCSCPFDMGPVCKHTVAVLYELRNRIYGHDRESGKAKGPLKTKRREDPQESLEKTLSRMPRKSLEKAVLEYALREPKIADYVFAKKALIAPASDKEQYRRIIKAGVDAARGKHGFIGYWQASDAVEGADMVLEEAEEFIGQSDARKALPVYQCILEEMVSLLQQADDSNGEIGSIIEEALEGLSICARLVKGALRQEMLDYLFTEFEHKRYDEWSDWRWNFLEIAAQIVTTSDERDRLFKKLDQAMKKSEGNSDSWSNRYDIETILKIKLTVLERQGQDKEVEDFLNEHIFYPAMRQRAIEKAFERKDYILVKKLSQEGIALGKQQKLPGIVNSWNVWILRAAEAEHDIPEVKKYTIALFIDTGDFDYYKRYKKCFSSDEWKAEVEHVINLVRKSKEYSKDVVAQILIHEQRWDDLLTLTKKDVDSYTLEHYERYLISRFSKELASMYEKVIVEELAPEAGRSNYRRTCQFLRRMKKVGAQERVKALIEELSIKYKSRPTFLEEIRRIN